jgi:hypothetical protein
MLPLFTPRHNTVTSLLCRGGQAITTKPSAVAIPSVTCDSVAHGACSKAFDINGGSAVVCGDGPGSFSVYDKCSNTTNCQIAIGQAMRDAVAKMCMAPSLSSPAPSPSSPDCPKAWTDFQPCMSTADSSAQCKCVTDAKTGKCWDFINKQATTPNGLWKQMVDMCVNGKNPLSSQRSTSDAGVMAPSFLLAAAAAAVLAGRGLVQ